MVDAGIPPHNPFCSRCVRPGALPFIFPPSWDAKALVEKLHNQQCWGQIVGPHGSGKSTLLETLIAALRAEGKTVTCVVLHDGQRRLPAETLKDANFSPGDILAIDGYEQLSWRSRTLLKWLCRRRTLGLLVTSHRDMRFPQLFRTEATPELLQQVVGHLLGDRDPPFSSDELSQLLSKHRGNLREVLFDLYDIYEQRCPPARKKIT